MAKVLPLGLRALQLFLILLITALVGNAIAEAVGGNPSVVNYAIFVAVFCWLTCIFGAFTAFTDSSAMPMVLMATDGLSALFTVIAGIALAAELGVHSCGNKSYLSSNGIVNGSSHRSKRCHELQASTAFFWFLFVTYVATGVIGFMSNGSGVRGGGLRKGGPPSMSQV